MFGKYFPLQRDSQSQKNSLVEIKVRPKTTDHKRVRRQISDKMSSITQQYEYPSLGNSKQSSPKTIELYPPRPLQTFEILKRPNRSQTQLSRTKILIKQAKQQYNDQQRERNWPSAHEAGLTQEERESLQMMNKLTFYQKKSEKIIQDKIKRKILKKKQIEKLESDPLDFKDEQQNLSLRINSIVSEQQINNIKDRYFAVQEDNISSLNQQTPEKEENQSVSKKKDWQSEQKDLHLIQESNTIENLQYSQKTDQSFDYQNLPQEWKQSNKRQVQSLLISDQNSFFEPLKQVTDSKHNKFRSFSGNYGCFIPNDERQISSKSRNSSINNSCKVSRESSQRDYDVDSPSTNLQRLMKKLTFNKINFIPLGTKYSFTEGKNNSQYFKSVPKDKPFIPSKIRQSKEGSPLKNDQLKKSVEDLFQKIPTNKQENIFNNEMQNLRRRTTGIVKHTKDSSKFSWRMKDCYQKKYSQGTEESQRKKEKSEDLSNNQKYTCLIKSIDLKQKLDELRNLITNQKVGTSTFYSGRESPMITQPEFTLQKKNTVDFSKYS